MTAGELIEQLRLYAPDAEVVVQCEHDSYAGHQLVEGRPVRAEVAGYAGGVAGATVRAVVLSIVTGVPRYSFGPARRGG